MKTVLILLTIFFLTSCNRTSDEKVLDRKLTDVYKDSIKRYNDRILTDEFQDSMREVVYGSNPIGGIPNIILQPFSVDSADLKFFMSTIIHPIINVEKKTVLDNMSFPVIAELTTEDSLEVINLDRVEFEKNYDWLFNNSLIESLTYEYKSIKDIKCLKTNDTLWYIISPPIFDKNLDNNPSTIELSSVTFYYFKVGGKFKLKHFGASKRDFFKEPKK